MESQFNKFEGPEKKLEIILLAPQPGLRDNADQRWDQVAEASHSHVISAVSSPEMDAYLLSESSLFVWSDRILMITCGRTTLARALPRIAEIVGAENVAFVFYEQKNFLYPQEQPSSFEADVAFIETFFPGKYYKLGPANDDHVNVFYASPEQAAVPEGDITFQILMHDLASTAGKTFCATAGDDPDAVCRISGIADLYNLDLRFDCYLFEPFGYSLNGIAGGQYMTIHVTPQPEGSYTSFECNIPERDYGPLIQKVTDIFKPARFSVVLTTGKKEFSALHPSLESDIPGFRITDKSLYEFDCGYGVSFFNYQKTQ